MDKQRSFYLSSKNTLNLSPEGLYRIVSISFFEEMNRRLLETGFLPGKSLYIICNNSLGIQIRINNAIYLVNQEVASMIQVEPIGE